MSAMCLPVSRGVGIAAVAVSQAIDAAAVGEVAEATSGSSFFPRWVDAPTSQPEYGAIAVAAAMIGRSEGFDDQLDAEMRDMGLEL